jgi:hypothetical protein
MAAEYQPQRFCFGDTWIGGIRNTLSIYEQIEGIRF